MDEQWLTASQLAPLHWRPLYVDRLRDPSGAAWVWPVIQDVCSLPDPHDFPMFDYEWDPKSLAMLNRYNDVCERLVTMTFLNSDARVRIELLKGKVSATVQDDDVTLGFITLLRQLFKHTEEASFDAVRNVLARAASDAGAESAGDVLRMWKKAHRTLLHQHHHALIEQMAANHGLMEGEEPHGARPFVTEDIAPGALLEVFLYGDLLHWGDARATLEKWRADAQQAALMDLHMRKDAHTLAHFYLGFDGVVRRILQTDALDRRT